jgi:hypothetical protein
MSYKPPLHIINKEKARPQENFGPKQRSEAYKMAEFTLSYQIKGTMIGLALAILYCNFYLHRWSELYLLGGIIAGFSLGWAVGRFFYSSKN